MGNYINGITSRTWYDIDIIDLVNRSLTTSLYECPYETKYEMRRKRGTCFQTPLTGLTILEQEMSHFPRRFRKINMN